ncbi:MAG: Vault protein inter-alpha-trypsin [Syntrophorhabdus sp. PtaB.Bin184]|nr:MAG: Vault protein inter-alpha-trypsin [Syntrophorhabdus sp. PtaB.Bin184]
MKGVPVFIVLFAVLCSVLFLPGLSQAQKPEDGDKTLSPYFFVKSDDPKLDQLPLKSTSAVANISGVIADVVVTQVYKNEGKKALEAIYVFPASTRAAVYGMKMVIGKRVIEAKVKKRDEARKDYEDAKKQGKSASLLEQHRPNVFQMNVANIMPGDEIRVELKYTEVLVPTDRIYEFAYPTVVGPRYSNKPADGALPSEKWVQNPYLHEGEKPTYAFDMTVNIAGGIPIKELASTSHKVNTAFNGPANAKVTLDRSEKSGGNKDYILRWRLAGDRMQSGLLLYKGEKENFFLCMLQPPKKVKSAQIPAREYIFVVDVSGSMYGFPLDISKRLLKSLIGNLRPTDTFNVLLFSGGSRLMSEKSLPATKENVDNAINVIDRQRGGGGTELLPALNRVLTLPKLENYSRSIIVVTDGYVRVEEEVFDLIRTHLNDANVFAFGIGSSVNRHIIEGMARVGMGEPFVITKPADAPAQADRFRAMIESPVLTKVKVSFTGFSTYDVEPVSIPDVLADRPVMVFGKYKGEPKGTITVTGISGRGKFTESINVAAAKPLKDNVALRYLWARHRITLLSDYNKLHSSDRRVKEVTDLGLAYNLLTAYTSFVAVDNRVRNTGDTPETVNQPLPLPEGVSDYAVGGSGMMKTMAMAPPPLAPYPRPDYMGMARREEAPVKENGKQRTVTGPTVSIGDVTVSGGIAKEAVFKTMRKIEGGMAACATGITGPVSYVVTLTVNADGTVKDVKSRDGRNDSLEQCLKRLIKQLKFTATGDGKEASATVTILLKP